MTDPLSPSAGDPDDLSGDGLSDDGASLPYARYGRLATRIRDIPDGEDPRPVLRVAVLRNFTIEPLIAPLEVEAWRSGFRLDILLGDFDAVSAEVLDPDSALYRFAPDVVILAQWLDTLSPALTGRFLGLSEAEVRGESARLRSELAVLLGALRRNSTATVLVNNFPLAAEPSLGILDAQSADWFTHTLLRLNLDRLEVARSVPDVHVVDLMRLMAGIGWHRGIDRRYWFMAGAPLGVDAQVALAREYVKFLRALRGKTRKCLILDCDNTIWGGILGEDGPSGIRIGDGYPGSCYRAIQEEALNLHDRGVLLALCSKNNESDVLEVLRTRTDMLLREEHLAAYAINWNDKATNLRHIARRLNIGLDSLVFVDDSAFELGLVRRELPEVATFHLSDNLTSFREEFTRRGYFDGLTLSEEDRRRTGLYRATHAHAPPPDDATDLAGYLATLDIRVEIGLAGDAKLPRIAQLCVKTNQFNLTTRRYSLGDLQAMAVDSGTDIFWMRVRDRIVDHGLVGVAIVRYRDDMAEIDSLLMSCRVLGRGVEDALLATVIRHAFGRNGITGIGGCYIATDKNGQTAGLYSRMGFEPTGEQSGTTLWRYPRGEPPSIPPWLTVTFVSPAPRTDA